MRRPFIIIAKSVLALLSLMGVSLLFFAGYLVWHYEYGIGLPNRDRLAAVSATGPACSADPQRIYVPLADIPPLLRKAVILYDEPDFYERWSANPFVEHALAFVFDRKPRLSNITVSVTRCLMSLAEGCCRNLDWHVGNAILQNRVARTLSRDRILEIYLNESYLGRSSYGLGAASMSYFGKPLGLLTISEIAFVAALSRAPLLLDRRHDIARERRNAVIDKMLQAGVVNSAEAASARERSLEFRESPSKLQKL